MIQRLFSTFLILTALMFTTACGVTVIEPGYVGIKVHQNGLQRGVNDFPVLTGRQFYNPITETIYTFPTYTQRVAWDLGGEDGKDESITVRSAEGMSVNLDIAFAYSVNSAKVPQIFVKFRKDIDVITDGYLRDTVRNVVNNHASTLPIMQLMGPGLQKMTTEVETDLRKQLEPMGFIIDSVSLTGKPRVDKSVDISIQAVLNAQQKALETEQQIRTAEAEAQKTLATARGRSEAILMEAKAQAEANKIIAESLNQYGDKVLESKALDRWNGVLPQVTGSGGTPFITIPRQ